MSALSSTLHQALLACTWTLARGALRLGLGPRPGGDSAFVLSCDAVTLVGSKGDEAMMTAILQHLRTRPGVRQVFVSVQADAARACADRLGLQRLEVWGSIAMPLRLLRQMRSARPRVAFLMGADIMDGHYSPVEALRRIVAADLLQRAGVVTAFTGFSLNDHPAAVVPWAFRRLHPGVRVHLRDPLSLQRFERRVGVPARLVADVAFMLQPDAAEAAALPATRWIAMQRALGQRVVAVNLHPLLFRGDTAGGTVQALVQRLAAAMAAVPDVAWLLLPHDDRPGIGDLEALQALLAALDPATAARTLALPAPPTAAGIKALAATLDGVVTGRMHLAIAALGGGVPVLAFAYQGKFEGLLRHFGLPAWVAMAPSEALADGALQQRLVQFVAELQPLRAQVAAQWPAVKALAARNFEDRP